MTPYGPRLYSGGFRWLPMIPPDKRWVGKLAPAARSSVRPVDLSGTMTAMPAGMPLPSRPVRGPGAAPSVGGLLGVWRATVSTVEPETDRSLWVRVPALTGERERFVEEYAAVDPPLAVGDRVWVVGIEGSRDNLAVIARRA